MYLKKNRLMLKQIWISCLLAILTTSFVEAKKSDPAVAAIFSDTVDIQKKDSLAIAATPTLDPKDGFGSLFTDNSGNGLNTLQLNPLATSFVEDYMDKFGKSMEEMKDWGRPYFDKMDAILVQHGLPKELKYLAVIESQLKSNARSWAGAVGPWQFMPTTAKTMGLRITRKIDERRDLAKSTHAASRYLTSLFELYGDWLLVIAAYNGGPGKVNYAIKKSGSRDFWTLQNFLPAESRNHVKKFIATHYIMEGEGGITTLTKKETDQFANTARMNAEDSANSKTQMITGRYNAAVISKHLSMDLATFNRINPNFDKLIATNGKYEMRLPIDKMTVFANKKYDILNESIQLLLNADNQSARMP